MMKNGKEEKQEFIAFNTHLDRWGELARREQSSLVCLPLLSFLSFLSLPPFFPCFLLLLSFCVFFYFLICFLLQIKQTIKEWEARYPNAIILLFGDFNTAPGVTLTSPSLSPSSLSLFLSTSLSSVVIYRYTLSSLPNFPVGQGAHTTLTSHMADSWDWCKDHSNTCITNNFSASFHGTHLPSPLFSSSYFFSCL